MYIKQYEECFMSVICQFLLQLFLCVHYSFLLIFQIAIVFLKVFDQTTEEPN